MIRVHKPYNRLKLGPLPSNYRNRRLVYETKVDGVTIVEVVGCFISFPNQNGRGVSRKSHYGCQSLSSGTPVTVLSTDGGGERTVADVTVKVVLGLSISYTPFVSSQTDPLSFSKGRRRGPYGRLILLVGSGFQFG